MLYTEIDFTDPTFEELIHSLNNGTYIFLGAGISKLAGYKLWNELKEKVVDYFWKNRERIKKKDFDKSICDSLKDHSNNVRSFDYLYYVNSELFEEAIKNIFKDDKYCIKNQIYEYVNKLNNGKNLFVTTNVDDGFQSYLGLHDSEVNIYPKINSKERKQLTYLHGRIDKPHSWVFTTNQYISAYNKQNSPCKNFISNISKENCILFMGYRLEENELLSSLFSDKMRNHYWIEGIYRKNQDYIRINATSHKKSYNINLISYSIDHNDYEELYGVVDFLYDEMNKYNEGE